MSESAASCAALLPLLWGGGDDVFLLLIENASLKIISIRPDWTSSSRWEMIVLMVSSLRCFFDVGARMSSSRCTNNHQNGADVVAEFAEMIDSIILAWIVWYRFLLLFLRV